MNYDKGKIAGLVDELSALWARETQLVDQLRVALGSAPKLGAANIRPVDGEAPAKPKTPKRKGKKGTLQKLVLQVMQGYKTPKHLREIATRVIKQRPESTQASVATVLHGLAKRGILLRGPEAGTFLLHSPEPSLAGPPAPAGLEGSSEQLES